MSDRIYLFGDDGAELTGWALNVSRGGVRAIVEEQIDLGAVFAVALGEDPTRRRGRVVWIQEEPDGAIVGIEFLAGEGADEARASVSSIPGLDDGDPTPPSTKPGGDPSDA